jgi:hypothetical protein
MLFLANFFGRDPSEYQKYLKQAARAGGYDLILARRQLNELPDELWTMINIEFYKDAADVVFKALET